MKKYEHAIMTTKFKENGDLWVSGITTSMKQDIQWIVVVQREDKSFGIHIHSGMATEKMEEEIVDFVIENQERILNGEFENVEERKEEVSFQLENSMDRREMYRGK